MSTTLNEVADIELAEEIFYEALENRLDPTEMAVLRASFDDWGGCD